LAWREERTGTRNLTLHYDRMMLLLDPTSLARGLVRKKVEVVNYPDGRFAIVRRSLPRNVPPLLAPRVGGLLRVDLLQYGRQPLVSTIAPGCTVWILSNTLKPSVAPLNCSRRRVCRCRRLRQRSGSRADCHRAFSCIPFSGDATRQAAHLRAVARWGFLVSNDLSLETSCTDF
jgi:hypothetical protein